MKRQTDVEVFSGSEIRWPQKSPRIDIKFPILGFLMQSEMTGYDLRRQFRDPIGFFYRASYGSLYPALRKLEHDGMVTMHTERRGRRARKLYAITPKGREQFLRTLHEPAQPIFVFDEAQVKIYFAHHNFDIALQHIEREYRFAAALDDFLRHRLQVMKGDDDLIRTGMLEIGCKLVALKADLLQKLASRLARELGGTTERPRSAGRHTSQASGRARAVPRSGEVR